ncbi:MAG: hypothetical protein ACYDEP_01110 [Acidimicrobiales bacterium]
MVKRTLLVILIAMIVAGCGVPSPPPGTGDPGNAKLHTLDRQAIFHVLPPGATLTKPIRLIPAKWDYSWYGGWNNPAVTVSFQSSESIQAVYTFYANEAAATGWHPVPLHTISFGLQDVWSKTLPDGATADLMLTYGGPDNATSPNEVLPYPYTLNGEVAAKVR